MTVYLIHFEKKFSHAQHYIGFVKKNRNLKLRMSHHRNGTGAVIMKHVTQAGIPWKVVRTWKDAGRDFERRLKNCHKPQYFCPICNPKTAMNNMALEKKNDPDPCFVSG